MINVATDCSGIEAPIQALRKLGIEYNHIFSSDIDKHCRRSIMANYSPCMLFEDMLNRNLDLSGLPIHLYVCGFSCQPFSTAGNQQGFNDKRSDTFHCAIETIVKIQPFCFILENVAALKHRNNATSYSIVQERLKSLNNYEIVEREYNTKDYGLPQYRNRIYFIGIRKDVKKCEYVDIEKVSMKSLEEIYDYDDRSIGRLPNYVNEIPKDGFCDLGFSKYYTKGRMEGNAYAPALTTKGSGYWNCRMNRLANVKELLRLQGFDDKFKQVVSTPQMKKQIGNSMSVDVIALIVKSLLKSIDA